MDNGGMKIWRLVFCLLVFPIAAAWGQSLPPENSSVQSVSGQFTVTAAPQFSPLLQRTDLATNRELVRLQPALLAVSAERFRNALWAQLGFQSGGNELCSRPGCFPACCEHARPRYGRGHSRHAA